MASNRQYTIAVIPGDGSGNEVVPQGLRVLDAVSALWLYPQVHALRLELRALQGDPTGSEIARAVAAV